VEIDGALRKLVSWLTLALPVNLPIPAKPLLSLETVSRHRILVLCFQQRDGAVWLDGSVNDAIALQRPLPNELLHIVATREKNDRAEIE
jgi:hypothetical protein